MNFRCERSERSRTPRSPVRHLSSHRAPLTADGLLDVSGGFAAGKQETFCGSKLVWLRWVLWSLQQLGFSPIWKLCYWAVLSSDIAVKLVSGWMLDTSLRIFSGTVNKLSSVKTEKNHYYCFSIFVITREISGNENSTTQALFIILYDTSVSKYTISV